MVFCHPTYTDWSCRTGGRPVPPEDATPEQVLAFEEKVDWAESLAWSTLAFLSAWNISACPTLIRPCRKSCAGESYLQAPTMWAGYGILSPVIVDGAWFNMACGCSGGCSCTTVQEVILPAPVGGIEYVMIDGVALDPSAYRVDDGNRLVRQDGGSWPYCQDMNKPPTEVGTFAVSYYQGAAPNPLVAGAAGILADEFYKSCTGGKCRLPGGIQNITRQGVSVEFIGTVDLFAAGLTGILEVDMIIRLYNPNGLKMPPQVMIPGRGRPRVTTWSS